MKSRGLMCSLPMEITAQITPLLPDELIVQILSWLPVKSLIRFRCVSKSLKSLICDLNLVKLHLQRSPKNTNIMLTYIEGDPNCKVEYLHRCSVPCSIRSLIENSSSTIPSIFGNSSSTLASLIVDQSSTFAKGFVPWPSSGNFEICGSCNGLVCLHKFLNKSKFIENCFYIWNPATRLRSNKSPDLHVPSYRHSYGFANFGFGYDESRDTYKVVAAYLDGKLENTEFKVLNMGDGCWRNMMVSCPAIPFTGGYHGQFVNGTLNWLALRKFGSSYSRWNWLPVTVEESVIFSLDIRKETYKHLVLPDGLDQVHCEDPKLGILMDCLCLFHDYKRTHFVVWKMNEFGDDKSWTQFVNVSYLTLQNNPYPTCQLLPLCTYENGDGVLIRYIADYKAILYNRRHNRAQFLEFHSQKCWECAHDYVESLILPC